MTQFVIHTFAATPAWATLTADAGHLVVWLADDWHRRAWRE